MQMTDTSAQHRLLPYARRLRTRWLEVPIAPVAVLILASCGAPEPPQVRGTVNVEQSAPDTVAQVDDYAIGADEFRRAMVIRGGGLPGRYQTLAEKKALLQELIQTHALAIRAREEGLVSDAEIRQAVDQLLAEKYLEKMRSQPLPATEPTEEEIRSYYESHQKDFSQSARHRGSLIFFKIPPDASAEQIEEVKRRASATRSRLAGESNVVEAFGLEARVNSNDLDTREKSGDFGWVPLGGGNYRWDPSVFSALFELRTVGEMSELIRTQRGFYIVLLTGYVEDTTAPLDRVSNQIRAELTAQRATRRNEEKIRKIQEGVIVKIDEAALGRVGPTTVAQGSVDEQPPAFPIGSTTR